MTELWQVMDWEGNGKSRRVLIESLMLKYRSNATFNLSYNYTSRDQFRHLYFGVWKAGRAIYKENSGWDARGW
jgi:hypothetical protein